MLFRSSLGNLFRATKGTARVSQTSSMNDNNGGGSTQVALSDFAVDSITHNHVFTYVIEGTNGHVGSTSSGIVPYFTTTLNSPVVRVDLQGQTYEVGDAVDFNVSTTVGGIPIYGRYIVTKSVITSPTGGSYVGPPYPPYPTTGYLDRKSTRLNSSHSQQSRMPSSA